MNTEKKIITIVLIVFSAAGALRSIANYQTRTYNFELTAFLGGALEGLVSAAILIGIYYLVRHFKQKK